MILLLFITTMAIALLAQWHVKRIYHRYSRVPAMAGYTGAEVAREILSAAGIGDVSIHEHEELLGDHYDPPRKRLVLSSANYHGTSLAAIGVSAHECGHAIQHKQAYAPLHLRMAAIGITSFASQIVLWLPLVGIMTGILAMHVGLLLMAVAWGIIMAFNLITLPVEFDASQRALKMLRDGGVLVDEEIGMAKKVLSAAAMTYVAATLMALLNLLRMVLISRSRD